MTTLTPRLETIFRETRTVCFGRFVITVPASATVVYGPAQAESEIFYYSGDAGKVDQLVQARILEVEKEGLFLMESDKQRLPLFGKVKDGIREGQKIVIGSKLQSGYTVHSYIPVGADLFVQYFSGILPDQDPFDAVNAVARRLTSRLPDFIPAEPGVCIEGGFIAKDMMYEQATIGIRLKEFPDVHLSVDVHKNLQFLPEQNELEVSLKQGEEEARQRAGGGVFDRIRIFRHGTRQLGKWKGFEHASRMPAYEKNTDTHEFYFHAIGAINDRLLPQLDIQLDTGVKDDNKAGVEPSITDEEALALWDKLINTIRARQPGDATPVKTQVPLSSLTKTGASCPETGWWECMEHASITGGRRRMFAVGEIMPPVFHVAEPNLWQKMTGNRSTFQISTTWKLVDYAKYRAPE